MECMYVCMCFFMYIIKYAPSPGIDTTYYNVSSYTFLFMDRGCLCGSIYMHVSLQDNLDDRTGQQIESNSEK